MKKTNIFTITKTKLKMLLFLPTIGSPPFTEMSICKSKMLIFTNMSFGAVLLQTASSGVLQILVSVLTHIRHRIL